MLGLKSLLTIAALPFITAFSLSSLSFANDHYDTDPPTFPGLKRVVLEENNPPKKQKPEPRLDVDLAQITHCIAGEFFIPREIIHNILGEVGLFLTLIPAINSPHGITYYVKLELEQQDGVFVIGYRNKYGLKLLEYKYISLPTLQLVNFYNLAPQGLGYGNEIFFGYFTPIGFEYFQRYAWSLIDHSDVLIPLKTYATPLELDDHFNLLYAKRLLDEGRYKEAKERFTILTSTTSRLHLKAEADKYLSLFAYQIIGE